MSILVGGLVGVKAIAADDQQGVCVGGMKMLPLN